MGALRHGGKVLSYLVASMKTIENVCLDGMFKRKKDAKSNQLKQNTMLVESIKELAKQLIEIKYQVKVKTIQMEDGSGRCFNVVHQDGTEKFYRL